MSSFTNNTIRVLAVGALVLGAGLYYEGIASQRVEEARQALRSVEVAQSQVDRTRQYAEQYIHLLEDMADENVDRQEPFSVVSEFSPREIEQMGPLLDTLYQRDGHFFLQRFQLSWLHRADKPGHLPKVVLDLEGRKVLLFSNNSVDASPLTIAKR